MKKWGMILVLITVSVYSFCGEKAPWDGIELTQPFKNTWSARIEDNEGGHNIRNAWVESRYLKSKKDITEIMKKSVDERTIKEVMAKYQREFENLLFVETEDHRLYALEIESGVIKWVTYFPDKIQFKPMFGKDYVFCTSDEILFATNREYGLLAWRKPLTFPVSTSPIQGSAELLFLSSWENRIFCLDSQTRLINWQFRVDGNIISTPVYSGGLIYIPCEDGNLYTIKSNGEFVYKFNTNGPIRKSPRVKGGFLYVSSDDNSVYCINRYNGEKIWECRVGRPIVSNPEVIEKNV